MEKQNGRAERWKGIKTDRQRDREIERRRDIKADVQIRSGMEGQRDGRV